MVQIICYRCGKKDEYYYRLKDISGYASRGLPLNEVVLCGDCGHELGKWIQNKRTSVRFNSDIEKFYKFNDLPPYDHKTS